MTHDDIKLGYGIAVTCAMMLTLGLNSIGVGLHAIANAIKEKK